MYFDRSKLLTVGKQELCALSERDVENERLLNRIRTKTSSTFLALYDIFQMQSDLRQLNVSRKRPRAKQASQSSLSIDVSRSVQVSFGTVCLRAR